MKTSKLYIFMFFILTQSSNQQKKTPNKKREIFEETKLKNLKLKNRLFRGSIGDYCAFKNGHLTEDYLSLYENLSSEGVGTIFTGFTMVSDYGKYENSGNFRIDSDSYIEEYKKLTSLVHKNNVNIIMQLAHCGAQTTISNIETIYSPSQIISPFNNKTTKEMTKEDIIRIEDDFLKGAIRAKKSEFDGIEIHAAHLYLLSQFLSPAFNKRTDEYGGSDENRARIIIEIIEKIRKVVGNDFIISLKINSDDGIKNGISKEGFLLTCQLAEKAGVDIIQVSGMDWVKSKERKPFFFESAKKLADIVNIPVLLIGGIRDVESIYYVLNNSNIEYVALGRPLICEPDLVKRWKRGIMDKAKCVSCNTCLREFSKCVFHKNKVLK